MGGSSLGGLVTLYLGLRYTWMFSKLAVMSPSVWWRNRAILKTVAQIKRKPELKIWLDIGTKESQRALPDAHELKSGAGQEGMGARARIFPTSKSLTPSTTKPPGPQRVAPMLKFLFPTAG